MITPKNVRHAIQLLKRVRCTGDEAKDVAETIDAFEILYAQLVYPPVQPNDESSSSKKDKKK